MIKKEKHFSDSGGPPPTTSTTAFSWKTDFCPESMFLLGIWEMHHLFDCVSFVVGYFTDFFHRIVNVWWLHAGDCWYGWYFPPLRCKQHFFRRKENLFRQILPAASHRDYRAFTPLVWLLLVYTCVVFLGSAESGSELFSHLCGLPPLYSSLKNRNAVVVCCHR